LIYLLWRLFTFINRFVNAFKIDVAKRQNACYNVGVAIAFWPLVRNGLGSDYEDITNIHIHMIELILLFITVENCVCVSVG
jgi:hypothetical protein